MRFPAWRTLGPASGFQERLCQERAGLLNQVKGVDRRGKAEAVKDFIFLGSKITGMVTAAIKLKGAGSLEGKL